jgi:antitoxin ParD1/3/4
MFSVEVGAMNFSLTPNLEQFIRDRASSGDYNNASEVVREAIRLLKRVEEQRALKLERLRAAISAGDEDIARGDSILLNNEKELDAYFAKL